MPSRQPITCVYVNQKEKQLKFGLRLTVFSPQLCFTLSRLLGDRSYVELRAGIADATGMKARPSNLTALPSSEGYPS